MTTGELLAASRQSHRNYLNAKKAGNIPDARSHLAAAQLHRKEAHESDPEHTDPAWLEDAKNLTGAVMRDRRRSVEQIARDNHDQLLQFYQLSLAGPIPMIAAPLTEPEVRARVIAPKGMAIEKSAAYRQLCSENGIALADDSS